MSQQQERDHGWLRASLQEDLVPFPICWRFQSSSMRCIITHYQYSTMALSEECWAWWRKLSVKALHSKFRELPICEDSHVLILLLRLVLCTNPRVITRWIEGCIWSRCWFLIATAINYHQLCGLKQHENFISQFWRPEVSRESVCLGYSEGVSRAVFPPGGSLWGPNSSSFLMSRPAFMSKLSERSQMQ